MAGRAYETSRLEGFSDTVFGFALTLLVVSLEVPSSFEALRQQMEGFFMASFDGWNGHLAAKALTAVEAVEAVAPHTIDGGVPHA